MLFTKTPPVFVGSLCALLSLVILFLGYSSDGNWSGGNFNAEAMGYFVGSLLTPFLIAWLIVWLIYRKRNPKPPASRGLRSPFASRFSSACCHFPVLR
jgi:hypothetical protein